MTTDRISGIGVLDPQRPITGTQCEPDQNGNLSYLRHSLLWTVLPNGLKRAITRVMDLIARVCRRISERENWETPYYRGRYMVALTLIRNVSRGVQNPYTAAESAFARSRLARKISAWLDQRRAYWHQGGFDVRFDGAVYTPAIAQKRPVSGVCVERRGEAGKFQVNGVAPVLGLTKPTPPQTAGVIAPGPLFSSSLVSLKTRGVWGSAPEARSST